MVKTCKVKVRKVTITEFYEEGETEKLICELILKAKQGRNGKGRSTFMCIYCMKMFESKESLNHHRLKGCDKAVDDFGKPLKLKLYPSMASGGAAEVKDILDKHNSPIRNAFNCIHCKKECASEQQLDCHHSMCSPGVPDITGQPLQFKLLPSVPSGGAAEFRNISEKHNFHGVCEPEGSDLLAGFDDNVLLGSPLQLPCKDGSELPDTAFVTPIVEKERPESHEVSAEFRDISEKNNFHGVREPEESDQPAGFGEDVTPHGSPLKLLWEDGSKLPDALCVTPIVYKEHPESHEVSFLVMDGLSFSPVFVYQEELYKEGLSICQGKGLFNFLRQKANKALCVASVPKREECISAVGFNFTGHDSFDYRKIYQEIVDKIVADCRVVKIADVPSTIWATTKGSPLGGKRVMNIIIMGCHEDCTRSHDAEGERWISWEGAGSLEGDRKGLSEWCDTNMEWVQDLLWNCNNLIVSRRGLMPKSGSCGNSSWWNEDIINITRQQQPDGEQFMRVFRLKSTPLSLKIISGLVLFWQEREVIVVAGYLACLAKIESNLQRELNVVAAYHAWIAKKKYYIWSSLDDPLLPVLIKWPVCPDKVLQASEGM